MKLEKLEKLSFQELLELKSCVNEILLRTHIAGTPTARWRDFNELLSVINKKIEDFVYDEYIK